MRERLLAAGVLVTVTAVTSCAGTSHHKSQTTPSMSTNPSAAQIAADRALAQRALLTIADFPQGWEASPDTQGHSSADTKLEDELASCLGLPSSLIGDKNPRRADAPQFTPPSDQQESVEQTVSFAATDAEADTVMNAYSAPGATACLSKALTTEVKTTAAKDASAKDVTVGSVQVGVVNFGSYGQQTIAWRATIPVSYKGLTFSEYADIVQIRQGRAGSLLVFANFDSPFPLRQAQRYAQIAAARLVALHAG